MFYFSQEACFFLSSFTCSFLLSYWDTIAPSHHSLATPPHYLFISGLRGAVGLALGLIVAESPYWDRHQYLGIPEERKVFFRDGVLFIIGGVAALTLLINGTTIGALVKYLGLNKLTSEIAERNLQRIIDELDKSLRKKIKKLKHDGSAARKAKAYATLSRQKLILAKSTSMGMGGQEKNNNNNNNNDKDVVVVGGEHKSVGLTTSLNLSTSKRLSSSSDSLLDEDDDDDGRLSTSDIGEAQSMIVEEENQKTQGNISMEDNSKSIAQHHINHHEFENVDWKTVFQYMPVESPAVYKRRMRKDEITEHWGTGGFMFCSDTILRDKKSVSTHQPLSCSFVCSFFFLFVSSYSSSTFTSYYSTSSSH